ncbi:MAG: response regulator [Proteobacteria bacterium]|nr:response regulator [Pseudomonadota bacterium]
MSTTTEIRVLIVDPAIHADFRKILARPDDATVALDELEARLFDAPVVRPPPIAYELVSAMQGQEALALVEQSVATTRPFALAFVDMRMPPGWDGVETIERIWRVDPAIQIVICSAFSDCSWNEVRRRVGATDSLLILKKPFDTIEVVQCAQALATKWTLARHLHAHIADLEGAVQARTRDLQESNARLAEEMQQRAGIERDLRLAQKLEAVGQLAAGIAHEINTPIQYVGDNLAFLRESVEDLVSMAKSMIAVAASPSPHLVDDLARIADKAELDYLATAIPESLDSITGGVERIARIVRTMKELAHPGPREATEVDIPSALRNALEVTAGAYRLFADVVTDFTSIPTVVCFGSEINQVFFRQRRAGDGGGGQARQARGLHPARRGRPRRRDLGHRRRHPRVAPRSRLRLVLHDQGGRAGDGAGPRHLALDRRPARGLADVRVRGRRGDDVHDAHPDRRSRREGDARRRVKVVGPASRFHSSVGEMMSACDCQYGLESLSRKQFKR